MEYKKREVRPELLKFGTRLQEIRRSREMTQERLAEVSGLERAYVSNAETGRRNATLTTIYKLAGALGVDPAELVAGTGPRRTDSPL